jgi:hypothetical protein
MHFTHHAKVYGDMELHYYEKKLIVVKTIGLCN